MSRQTILIVDDVVENISILGEALVDDYEVRFATSGHDALKIAGEGQPIDLILLDIMMPGISGLDVLRELRRTRSARELPIIMVSALDDSEAVVAALELGANDYVAKPIDLEVLKARIRTQLRVNVSVSAELAMAQTENLTVAAKPGAKPKVAVRKVRPAGPIDPHGTVFAEKYRVEEQIGVGGYGTVYRATHLYLKQSVALKVLNTSLDTSPAHLARFQREGMAASRLHHKNAVSVLDFGVTATGKAYLVMELLQGRPLSAEMKARGALSCQRCSDIVLPVCDVLSAAHHIGFLHRDLKPDNIFLHQQGGQEVVKVVDFGTAKLLDNAEAENSTAESLTAQGTVIGTPKYMSPERLSARPSAEPSDVYSLGVMAFEMLAGCAPFVPIEGAMEQFIVLHVGHAPPPLQEFRPELPADLATVVMETLRKDPATRPSAAEFGRRFGEAACARPAQ
jgi:CheY-like chemotaxis protein/tRNA A-37 threonylcarbamoyl transferase component Bud32